MRIRSIKPEFWRSKTIADLSWDARLVLKGLESYVDDNGVGKYDLELIISDVFSRDHYRKPRETVARVSEAISELISAGLVIRYQVDGEELLYIDKWKDIQRVDKPNSGRYRRPDGTLEYTEPVNRDSYRKPREEVANPPEILPSVTGEQGSSGTEEQGTGEQEISSAPDGPDVVKSDYPQAFEDWWECYPRKDAKRKALEAWRRARKRATDQDLIVGAERYALDPNRQEQYTKQPATWLNGDCWLSAALPATNGYRVPASDAAFAAAQALKKQPSRLELEQ